jgi:hypothetical protein
MMKEPMCSHEDHYGNAHDPKCQTDSECTVCYPRLAVHYEVCELSDSSKPILVRARFEVSDERTDIKTSEIAQEYAHDLSNLEDKRFGVIRTESILVRKFG